MHARGSDVTTRNLVRAMTVAFFTMTATSSTLSRGGRHSWLVVGRSMAFSSIARTAKSSGTSMLRMKRMATVNTISSSAAMTTTTTRNGWMLHQAELKHRHQQQQQQQGFWRRHGTTATRTVALSASSTSTASDGEAAAAKDDGPPVPVPMTLLSGFLGSGKTSALKHALENTDGDRTKIGVIVNDVASVNIDARLIASRADGMVELQNGCACCSLADELYLSVEKLLRGGRDLDAIVVELSGVADPVAIKSNWRVAPPAVRAMADVSRVVTLVDANTFGTDYMTWDAAREREGWTDPGDDCAGRRQVAELLAEQVEAADLILVNKVDLATDEEIEVASSVARALNDKAELKTVRYGRIDPLDLIATKTAVAVGAAKEEEEEEGGHDHGHSHDHHEEPEACNEPGCTDPSHSHSHSHDHATSAATAECTDPECTDSGHSHSHEHSHDAESCSDPNCTDHSHEHSHEHSTSTDKLGITSFVYRESLPFNPQRLMALLNRWPVPVKDTLDVGLLQEAQEGGYSIGGRRSKVDSPFVGVLRSKGFCWFAPSKWSGANEDAWRHDTAMYWSHAGKHFSVTTAGKWWGTITKEQMKKYFTSNEEEYERILKEDFVSEEFGDRRQELVFIGTNLDEGKITAALDECIVTEREMDRYRQKLRNYLDTIATTSGSLFDIASINHADME